MKKKILAVLALTLSFSLVAEGVGLAINIDPTEIKFVIF